MINWASLSAQERLSVNSMLDKERSLDGVQIPSNVRIVGLINKPSQDSSFVSRHDKVFEKKYSSLDTIRTESTAPVEIIDFNGYSNWQEILFGKIFLQDNKFKYMESKFANILTKKNPSRIEIINVPDEIHAKLNRFLHQGLAQGYFIYHGKYFLIADNFDVKISDQKFDFSGFKAEAINLTENVDLRTVRQNQPSGAPITAIINSLLFEKLLNRSHIEHGKYTITPGLIELAKAKELSLFITSELTLGQWYALFHEAQTYQVTLNLMLAPEIKIPEGVNYNSVTHKDDEIQVQLPNIKVIISNDPNAHLKIKSLGTGAGSSAAEQIDNENTLDVAVEDYSYQDLITKLTFEKTSFGFSNFRATESELLQALKAGKRVRIYGEFSQYIIDSLSLVLSGEIDISPGTLELIIEDKQLTSDTASSSVLTWLPQNMIDIKFYSKEKSESQLPIYDETDTSHSQSFGRGSDSDSDSESAAEQFMMNRLEAVTKTLYQSPMLQLIGPSGVGKSSLMIELSNQPGYKVYNELHSLDSWAQDTSDNVKILFIDESNIEDLHFTFLEPLKPGGNKIILHNGKLFELSDNHKVIFARNPHEYGGGRVEQKLFKDGSIPELIFSKFPAEYLYEKIMKPIYQKSSITEKISEKTFKQDCLAFISHNTNDNTTARELQHWVIKYCTRQKLEKAFFQRSSPLRKHLNALKSSDFAHTKILADATLQASSLLHIKKDLRAQHQACSADQKNIQSYLCKQNGLGLNGVLIEGAPGMGKSELIKRAVEINGYKIVNSKDETHAADLLCYKIEPSLPLAAKKAIIVKAFDEGNSIWIDELNSCIDEGLEKILNAVLTGYNPDSKEPAKTPGFMLFATANSAGLEGRSIISPAIKHRCAQVSLDSNSLSDLQSIIGKLLERTQSHNLDSETIADFSKYLFEACDQGKKLNIRTIEANLPMLLEKYNEPRGSSSASFRP